jgi:hypothetical protein
VILAPTDKANGGFSGILVSAEEIYLHRGKALIRSDLWNSEKHLRRSVFSSLATALTEQIGAVGGDPKGQHPPLFAINSKPIARQRRRFVAKPV